MLSEKGYGPMQVNVLLILIGTPFAVWLMANPDSIAAACTWLDVNDVLCKVEGRPGFMSNPQKTLLTD